MSHVASWERGAVQAEGIVSTSPYMSHMFEDQQRNQCSCLGLNGGRWKEAGFIGHQKKARVGLGFAQR